MGKTRTAQIASCVFSSSCVTLLQCIPAAFPAAEQSVFPVRLCLNQVSWTFSRLHCEA